VLRLDGATVEGLLRPLRVAGKDEQIRSDC
jgi:hypothetical protein